MSTKANSCASGWAVHLTRQMLLHPVRPGVAHRCRLRIVRGAGASGSAGLTRAEPLRRAWPLDLSPLVPPALSQVGTEAGDR